jgi:thioredoxin reductase
MTLGRSLRQVLIIDSGLPCNRQAPHSHNFITHDGETPANIAIKAKLQVLQYATVTFKNGKAVKATQQSPGFAVETAAGETFIASKLLFATGVADNMPAIKGFAECWGISVIHCPYCHGYEVRDAETGILANGNEGFEYCRLIRNWTKKLTLFTNGTSALTAEQTDQLTKYNINIIETAIQAIEHDHGQIKALLFNEDSKRPLTALYARPAITQHCDIPEALGCTLTETGHIQVDEFQRTTIPGVYAAGDNTTAFRAVSWAVAAGTKAGAFINKDLIEEEA